jgi:hypothetical protein
MYSVNIIILTDKINLISNIVDNINKDYVFLEYGFCYTRQSKKLSLCLFKYHAINVDRESENKNYTYS